MFKDFNFTALMVAGVMIGAAVYAKVNPRVATGLIAVGSVIAAKQIPVVNKYV